VLADLRLALRLLLKHPGFAIVTIITLALGIGANTAIFSVVDGVLLRPAPVGDIERLVMVWETDRKTGTTREPASVPDFLDFQVRSRSFQTLAALVAGEVNFVPPTGEPVRLAALRVSNQLLPMLGIQPLAGRAFSSAEDVPKGPDVALISRSLKERAFGRDANVIGKALRLDERPYTIVGVMGDAADFGMRQILGSAAYSRGYADRGESVAVDVWLPLQPDPKTLPRATHPILVLGRLAPAATAASAQLEMTRITADLERAYPVNDGRGAFIEPLEAVVFGPVRPALFVLLGAVGLVLLVACVNVANLLLARGSGRMREVAVRTALGAGGRRLARQFLTESIVLTLVASVLGIALAVLGLRVLIAIAPPDVPRLTAVSLDLRVLAVALGVSGLVSLLFGMVPLLQAAHVDPQSTLKGDDSRSATTGRARSRLRSGLVIVELALAVVLAVGAALLVKSFWRLYQVDSGFTASGVLKAEYQLPATRYEPAFRRWPDVAEIHAFNDALIRWAAALPGVESVAIAGHHPLDPGFTNSFAVVGREAEAEAWPEISIRGVTSGYFRTVGLQLVRGRLLQDSDTTTATPVTLINEAAARRFFEGRDPLGAQIRFWGTARTIVGVVANERIQGLAQPPPIAAYIPLPQAPSTTGVLLVRTTGDPAALTSSVRGVIRDVDPALAVFGVEPFERTVSRSVSQRRFTMLLLVLFAALALLLAAIGIHGVLSYGVAQRTREIGIRMALGAERSRVLRLVVGEGLALALMGLGIGFIAALGLTRLLATLLFGVTPTDAATFASVALGLFIVACLSSYLPARRAAGVDPSIALRGE
jgi:putative ABC transport system permease protein